MPRASDLAVLTAAVLCYAALGAVLRVLPGLLDDPAALGLLVGAPALTGVVTRPGRRPARRSHRRRAGDARRRRRHGRRRRPRAGVGAATPALLASRLLVGAGEGAMMSAAVLWLLRLAGPQRRGQALGHIGLANYAGLTAGPLLAEALGLARVPVLDGLGAAAAAPASRSPPAPSARGSSAADAAGSRVLGRRPPPRHRADARQPRLRRVASPSAAPRAGTALVVPVFAAGVIGVRTLGA